MAKDLLIVEDGQVERERLLELFEGAGYGVIACPAVGDAEKELEHQSFRLAILDIGLGDKSGSTLFHTLRRAHHSTMVIIFTGNPSVHLKQRFLAEGAADYIVKASPEAKNDAFLQRVRDLLGEPLSQGAEGIPLQEFLERCVSVSSRSLFLDSGDEFPACPSCKGREYLVVFSGRAQLPPEVVGEVQCRGCRRPMDPEVA